MSRSPNKLIGLGVISAIGASLCCIMPVLALIAGSSGIASTFSWLDPARPYLIGLSVLVLGFAWYQKLRPQVADECGCVVEQKPRFIQSKLFLAIITLFSALMISFPYYSDIFFPDNDKAAIITEKSNLETVEFRVDGMTCEGCEEEVKFEVNKLNGVASADVDYENGTALVEFDKTKTNIAEITAAINSTGYSVTQSTIK